MERGKLPVTNYFYPRPPRGGRRSACRRKLRCCPISIHALREEGDCRHARDHAVQLNFYPRPPRGGRQYLYRSYHTLGGFLSTPSARRATPTATTSLNSRKNFYPRPPRGGRPVVVLQHVGFHQFLSTPSARRATLKTTITTNVGGISIHALREEGDRRAFLQGRLPVYFYPRPPRGGRPVMQDGLTRYVKFLSTPSARRATPRGKQATESTAISIHALREEGDVQAGTVLGASGPISIHALREEGDRRVVPLFGLTLYFYPRPPRGGRPPSQDRRGTTQNFYPRPPRGGRLGCRWALSRASRFLSTPSARRATRRRPRQRPVGRISIHALREEGDEPAAEAPAPTGISIHALREEGDAQ